MNPTVTFVISGATLKVKVSTFANHLSKCDRKSCFFFASCKESRPRKQNRLASRSPNRVASDIINTKEKCEIAQVAQKKYYMGKWKMFCAQKDVIRFAESFGNCSPAVSQAGLVRSISSSNWFIGGAFSASFSPLTYNSLATDAIT